MKASKIIKHLNKANDLQKRVGSISNFIANNNPQGEDLFKVAFDLHDTLTELSKEVEKARKLIKKYKGKDDIYLYHHAYYFVMKEAHGFLRRFWQYSANIWRFAVKWNIEEGKEPADEEPTSDKRKLTKDEYQQAIYTLFHENIWKLVRNVNDFDYEHTDAIILDDDVVYIRCDTFETLDQYYDCKIGDVIDYLREVGAFYKAGTTSVVHKLGKVQTKINKDIRGKYKDLTEDQVNKIIRDNTLSYYAIYLDAVGLVGNA